MNRIFAAMLLASLSRACIAAETTSAGLPPASKRPGVTFQSDISPIFEKSCIKCHGPEKAKAKLRLDTLEGALKGSDEGKVIVPGNSSKSVLVKAVAKAIEKDLWMPPTNNKLNIPPLTAEQIGLIRAWIDQGAK